MGEISGQAARSGGRRSILIAWVLYLGFFTVIGSAFVPDKRHLGASILYNILTNLVFFPFGIYISAELDRRRSRLGRDGWGGAFVLAVAAAIACEPISFLLCLIPIFPRFYHPQIFRLDTAVQGFIILQLWALVHVFVRSGERALAQERRIAAVRESMLQDETDALLYTLNPDFLVTALSDVARGMRTSRPDLAGETVIALAEHMRRALSASRAAGGRSTPAEAGTLEPSPRTVDLHFDGLRVRRRFLIGTALVWACLVGVVFIEGAMEAEPYFEFVARLAPQPVIGGLWCLLMARVLGRRPARPLQRLYREAAVLCATGLCLSTSALIGLTAGFGVLDDPKVGPWVVPDEFFYMLPCLVAWTAAWFVMDARRREIARLRGEADIREAALKARNAMLRQQVNPHFLFNALNALYTLILDGETERALGVIGAVQGFVERAGDPAHGDLVALSSELATQDAYLAIERVRVGERLQVERDIASDLQAAQVPHLILQPLVENAIKYGVSRTDAPVRVEISAARLGEELVLQVRDTGAPEAAPRPPGLGVGLKNVEGRLRSLYGDAGRLACRPLDPSGFLAEVRMPLVL